MKAKTSIKLLTAITSFSLLATVTGVVAWFTPKAIISKEKTPLKGETLGAYFAYGNGKPTTEENPNDKVYGITVPRHLYNLAWLQYLGFFNDDNTQYYFELADNIDMTDWALPPIGTEENPFIGNFNGNGYVIKGLTVSNNFSDFVRHPGEVQSNSFTQPHILGFFGVIGDINDNLPAASYSSAVNEFSNTGLTGLTIKTYLNDSLMGIAAGYVEGNMKNVAVDASTITLDSSITGSTTSYGGFTQNISDYSLVGYTTNKKQIKKVDETIYDVNVSDGYEFNASEQGSTTGWGGSIDMMSVMQRLQSIRNNSDSVAFDYKRTYKYHQNDEGGYTKDTTYSNASTVAANFTNKTYIINDNDEHGHFNIICDSGYEANYALLGGGHYETSRYYDKASHTGYKLTDGNSHYLSATSFTNNAGTITNATSDNACVWSVPTSGSGRISTQYYYDEDGSLTTYYLRVVNNTQLQLTTTQNNGTTFSRETEVRNGVTYVRYEYNGYYINFDGTNWVMSPIPTFTNTYPADPSTYIPTQPRPEPQAPTTPEPQEPTTPEPQAPTTPEPTEEEEPQAPATAEPSNSERVILDSNDFDVSANSYQITYTSNNKTYYLAPSSDGSYSTTTVPTVNNWNFQYRTSRNGNYQNGLPTTTSYPNNYNNVRISTTIGNTTYYVSLTRSGSYWNGYTYNFSLTTTTTELRGRANGTGYNFRNSDGNTYLSFSNNSFGAATSASVINVISTASAITNHNNWISAWNTYYSEHSTWETDHAQYLIDHAAWQAEQDAYQTAHDAWQAEWTAYNNAHADWEAEWASYNSDHSAWEEEVDQYNADYAYYVDYRDNVYPGLVEEYNDAYNQYVSDLSASHNIQSPSQQTTVSGPDQHYMRQTTGMNYDNDDVTYFPLSTVNGYSDLRPADNNTAYIVAGSNITSSTHTNTGWNSDSSTRYSDVLTRVRFGRFTISTSFADGEFTSSTGTWNKIYTVDDNLTQQDITNSTAYEKLKDAKTNLGSVMKEQEYVYGLHFMDAAISMNALTTAKYVKVNKEVHRDYQLPVNSIDFHLKEFGYINFMAGTYYNNSTTDFNNSFFALYQIERLDSNPNKINRIFEVQKVYKHSSNIKNYSYVYELKDIVTNTTYFTKPYKVIDAEGHKEWLYDTENAYANNQYVSSCPANYSVVFDCARIKKNNIDRDTFCYHAYFFEIPMNDGEFCLGSVSGAVGSYLMYLDIGANAAKVQRTIFNEHLSYETLISAHPDGVALFTLPTTFTKEVAVLDLSTDIDCSDSACVEIQAGYTNSFTIDRNQGDVTLTRTNQSQAPPVYSNENITLLHDSGSSTNLTIRPISSSVDDIKRLQYFDVNVNLGVLTRTIITDTTPASGSASRTIVQQTFAGTDMSATPTATYVYNSTTDQRDDMKVYNTSNGVRYSSANLIDTSVLQIGTVSNSPILTIRVLQKGGQGFDEELILEAVIDSNNLNGKYYKFNDYLISITPNGEDVVVVVQAFSTNKVIYCGTTQITAVNQEITIAN